MKIAVCIKRVPDSETRVKIAADGKSLDEAGVKFILNPYDEFAVEEALRRKEQAGSGDVVVVSLGPAAAQETIRTALAMGADRGVLLEADRVPVDGLEVAKALAAELKHGRAALAAGGLEVLGLTPPPQRKDGKVVGEGPAAVPELLRLLREEAKVL